MKGRTKSFISSLFCFGLGIVPVMADAGANHTGSTLQVTQQAKRSLSGTVTDATTGEPLIGEGQFPETLHRKLQFLLRPLQKRA